MKTPRLPEVLAPATLTETAPHIRAWWSSARISVVLLLALAPPFAVAAVTTGGQMPGIFAICLAVVYAWQALFAAVRRGAFGRTGSFDLDGVVTAALFAMLLPVDAPVWQIVLGVTFGIVIGEQIFGGRGRNILNPVVVGLSFLIFSFPAGGYDFPGAAGALWSIPGAILLIVTGLVSWRIAAAAAIGLMLSAAVLGGTNPVSEVLAGGFIFGVVFLACDPVCASATNPGRWLYGLLIGFLVYLGRVGSDGTADGLIAAVLIAQIFAPLADYGVIQVNRWIRGRRRG